VTISLVPQRELIDFLQNTSSDTKYYFKISDPKYITNYKDKLGNIKPAYKIYINGSTYSNILMILSDQGLINDKYVIDYNYIYKFKDTTTKKGPRNNISVDMRNTFVLFIESEEISQKLYKYFIELTDQDKIKHTALTNEQLQGITLTDIDDHNKKINNIPKEFLIYVIDYYNKHHNKITIKDDSKDSFIITSDKDNLNLLIYFLKIILFKYPYIYNNLQPAAPPPAPEARGKAPREKAAPEARRKAPREKAAPEARGKAPREPPHEVLEQLLIANFLIPLSEYVISTKDTDKKLTIEYLGENDHYKDMVQYKISGSTFSFINLLLNKYLKSYDFKLDDFKLDYIYDNESTYSCDIRNKFFLYIGKNKREEFDSNITSVPNNILAPFIALTNQELKNIKFKRTNDNTIYIYNISYFLLDEIINFYIKKNKIEQKIINRNENIITASTKGVLDKFIESLREIIMNDGKSFTETKPVPVRIAAAKAKWGDDSDDE
jgi:hypothetical protein